MISLLPLLFVVQTACGWDLAADWSDAVNPNGPWSCNAGAAPIPTLQANWAGTGNDAWAAAASGFGHVPAWMKLTQAGASSLGPQSAPGIVAVHGNDPSSGTDVDLANVTWTSPVVGDFHVNGSIWHTDTHVRGASWSLYLNGALLDSGGLNFGDAFGLFAPRSFSVPVSVMPGDVVKLEFARTSSLGTFACVQLSVTPAMLHLRSPMPGIAGQVSTIQIRGASPGGRVLVGYSMAAGAFNLPGCGGLQGCLQAPSLAQALDADASGNASFAAPIPLGLAGRTVLLQAAAPGACQVSNLVRHTF